MTQRNLLAAVREQFRKATRNDSECDRLTAALAEARSAAPVDPPLGETKEQQ